MKKGGKPVKKVEKLVLKRHQLVKKVTNMENGHKRTHTCEKK